MRMRILWCKWNDAVLLAGGRRATSLGESPAGVFVYVMRLKDDMM